MLRLLMGAAHAADVADRVIAVHADLGAMEWPNVPQLAATHAEIYGIPLRIVRAAGGTLFDRIVARGMWPDQNCRYCTAAMKRDPGRRLITALAAEARAAGITDRPVRFLNVMGMRAQESPRRRKMLPFRHDGGKTCPCPTCRHHLANGTSPGWGPSNTKKYVDEWLPIHHLTSEQVWAGIAESGVPYHQAYDWGMPRLSCVICPLAGKSALVRSAQLMPHMALAARAIERRIGHKIHPGVSMAQIYAEARDSPINLNTLVDDWAA